MQLRSDSWGQSVEEDGDDLPCQRESLHGFAPQTGLGNRRGNETPGEHQRSLASSSTAFNVTASQARASSSRSCVFLKTRSCAVR